MKYTININQQVLADTELDTADGSILDYLIVYCNSKSSKIQKNRVVDEEGEWTWVDYGTLLKDMPMLRIKSRSSLTPRIKKIEKEGFIKTKLIYNQKLFFQLNDTIDGLFVKLDGSKLPHSSVRKNERKPLKAVRQTAPISILSNSNTRIIQKPWSLEDKLNDMERPDNPNKMLNIIATFIREKSAIIKEINEAPAPAKRLSAYINRHAEWAKKIVDGDYTDKEIFSAIDRLKKKEEADRRKSEVVVPWVVSTIYKELTNGEK